MKAMKKYTFRAVNGRVVVKNEELDLPGPHRTSHWPKAEVAAVTIEGLTRVQVGTVTTYGVLSAHAQDHPAVSFTRTDGTRRQFRDVTESVLDIASELHMRGYPVKV